MMNYVVKVHRHFVKRRQ